MTHQEWLERRMFNLEKNRLIGRDGGVCQTWGRTRWLLGEEGDGGLRWDQ